MTSPYDVSVVVPTYDEALGIEKLIAAVTEQFRAKAINGEIVIVDDNSPDGTGKILDDLAKQTPNMFVLHRPGKMGIGSAHAYGINRAYKQGYRKLITMDCDFTHSPEYIRDFLARSDIPAGRAN